jgi:hypothetical protein
MNISALTPTSPRWLRFVVCALMCLVAMGAISVGTARPAAAAPTCDGDAPVPQRAGEGLAGKLDPGPENKVAPENPFAGNSTTTIYDQYGYAGLRFNTYDLGCDFGSGIKGIDAETSNFVANGWMKLAIYVAATTNSADRATREGGFFEPMDQVIATVSADVKAAVWTPWNGAAFAALAVVMLWMTVKGELPRVLNVAVWALLVLTLATAAINYPVRASHAADDVVMSTNQAITNTALKSLTGKNINSPNPQAAALVDQQLYPTWLQGILGSSTSEVAKKYGPDLFRASAMSYDEVRQADASSDAAEKITKEKEDLWHSTAEKVKDEDPTAYAILTGNQGERSDFAANAFIAMIFASLFRLVSSGLTLLGLGIFRYIVAILPAVAVPALISPLGGFMRRLMNMAGASVLNVIMFGVGAMVNSVIITAILNSSDSDPAWTQWLVGIVTVVSFIVFWPMLNLSQIAGMNLPGARLGVPGWAKQVAGMALGAKLMGGSVRSGVREGISKSQEEQEEAEETASGPVSERRHRRAPMTALDAREELIALPAGPGLEDAGQTTERTSREDQRTEAERRRREVIDVRLVDSQVPVDGQPIVLDAPGRPALSAGSNEFDQDRLALGAGAEPVSGADVENAANPGEVAQIEVQVDVEVQADGSSSTSVISTAGDGTETVIPTVSTGSTNQRASAVEATLIGQPQRPRVMGPGQEELAPTANGTGYYVYDPQTRQTVLVDEFGDVIEEGEQR